MAESQPPVSNEGRSLPDGPIGEHLLVDMHGVDAALLEDAEALHGSLHAALCDAGFHVLESAAHQFPGTHAGATAFVLLTESHAAVHSYPEHQYLALDVFSCGPLDPRQVVDLLQRHWHPRHVEIVGHARPLNRDAIELRGDNKAV